MSAKSPESTVTPAAFTSEGFVADLLFVGSSRVEVGSFLDKETGKGRKYVSGQLNFVFPDSGEAVGVVPAEVIKMPDDPTEADCERVLESYRTEFAKFKRHTLYRVMVPLMALRKGGKVKVKALTQEIAG